DGVGGVDRSVRGERDAVREEHPARSRQTRGRAVRPDAVDASGRRVEARDGDVELPGSVDGHPERSESSDVEVRDDGPVTVGRDAEDLVRRARAAEVDVATDVRGDALGEP